MSSHPHFPNKWITDGSEVLSLTGQLPFTRRKISGTHFHYPSATLRLEGLGQLKNPMTSSGIEPATFWQKPAPN
jgi:hypothetical protein